MSAIIPTVATTKVTTVTASVSDVGGAITPVYVFDGTTMYATMADWSPLGVPFSVEAKVISLTAQTQAISASTTGSVGATTYLGLSFGTDSWNHRISASQGAADLSVGISGQGALVGVTASHKIEAISDKLTASLNAQTNNIAGAPAPLTTSIGFIARRGVNYWHGPIWDLKLTDNSPIQDTDACMGDAIRSGQLDQAIVLAGDFEISFDWIRQDSATTNCSIIGSADDNGRVLIFDSDSASPDRVQLRAGAGNANYENAITHIAQGQHARYSFTRVSNILTLRVDGVEYAGGTKSRAGTFTLDRIGDSNTSAKLSVNTAIQNLVITDLTQSLTYTYPLDEGAGTVINNTDPTTGAAYNGNWTPDVDWQNIPNNSRYYPMRDGIPGAGVLQDVIGGHDATIVNYDENSWDYEPTQTITTASNAGTIGWLKDSYGDISRQQVQGYQRRMTSVRVDTVGDMAYIEWDIENLYPDITGIFLYWNGIGLLLNRTTPTSGLFSVAIPPTPETNWIAADGIERGISITAVKG